MVYGQWFCMTETWTTPKYSAVDQISCLVLHKHQRLTFLVHSKYCISALFGSFFCLYGLSCRHQKFMSITLAAQRFVQKDLCKADVLSVCILGKRLLASRVI